MVEKFVHALICPCLQYIDKHLLHENMFISTEKIILRLINTNNNDGDINNKKWQLFRIQCVVYKST